MLYDLTFLREGENWPPPAETERLTMYQKNQLLFESRAEEVYGHWVSVLSDTAGNVLEQTAYVLSFHRRLALLWGDYVAGDAPVVSATKDSESQTVKDIADDNRFGITLQEAAIDQSRYGDALFRLSRTDDGKAKIRPVSPAHWFPVVAPSDIREVKQHVLAYLFDNPDAAAIYGDEAKLLKVEIHDTNVVEHRVYWVEGNVIGGRIGNPAQYAANPEDWQDFEEVPPEVDGPLIIHAPGARTSDRLFGLDDFTAIDSAMEYLMWAMVQRQGILHKHLAPNMAGPHGQTETLEDGTEVYISGSKYFAVDDPSQAFIPQYITWDGKLSESFLQTEKLWEDVYLTSETTPAAFGQQKEGLAESGSALKRLLMAPLKKAARMQERLDDPVKLVLATACALQKKPGIEAQLEWHDGLPQDLDEETTREALAVEAGLTSVESAMKRLYHLTDEQVAEEMKLIEAEKKAKAELVVGPSPDFPSGGNGTPSTARAGDPQDDTTTMEKEGSASSARNGTKR